MKRSKRLNRFMAIITGICMIVVVTVGLSCSVSQVNAAAIDFSDSFESGFGNWTADAGTMSTSTVQKHGGSYSYVTDQATDAIYHSFGTQLNMRVTMWFYDDASDTAVFCLGCVDNDTVRGLGINTTIDTAKYIYMVGGTETATNVTRTTGWHKFEWDYTSGDKVDMYIDGILVASPTGVTYFSRIAMGNWWGGDLAGTNYFDDISLSQGPSLSIDQGYEFIVDSDNGAIRQFSYAYAYENNVFVSFCQHPDEIQQHPVDGMKISRDNGATWGEYQENADFYMASILKLTNGDLFGMCAYSYTIDARHSQIHYWKSTDDGATWTHYTGTITYPKDVSDTARFMPGLMQNADGSLQITANILWAEDAAEGASHRCAALFVKSTQEDNNGEAVWPDWTATEIAHSDTVGVEYDGFCEPGLVRCADNSLLVVMRTGNNCPMYQIRSTDEGATWSTPITLPGTEGLNSWGLNNGVWGKMPNMILMSNGVLVLGAGQDGCRLLFSQDGCGYSWGNYTTAFELSPESGACSDAIGIAQVSSVPNRLILISDNGAARPGDPITNPAIRGRYCDVVRTGGNGDTFESDTVGQVPAGYTEVGISGLVIDTHAYNGSKSLRVYDNSASVCTNIVKVTNAYASKKFEFNYYPVAFAEGGGNTFSINSGGNTNSNSVFHLKVESDGKIYWYDGNGDTKLSDTVVVHKNKWNKIVIDAKNTTNADVYVNNVYAGTIGKWNTFSTMDRIRFMSSGGALTGDDYYVDDVSAADSEFSDGFENGFGNWTTDKGTASVSTTQKHGGSSSYVTDQPEDAIYHTFATSLNKMVSMWFYDDASDTTVHCLGCVDNDTVRGLGINTAINTEQYIYRVGGTETASNVTRTTGWHKFMWNYTSGSKVDMYIDGILVASPTGVTSFNRIAIGNWWGGDAAGTNYFDDISVNTFSDDFENGTGYWTADKGTASTSTVQKYGGNSSYVTDQPEDAIYHSFGTNLSRRVSMWFYDDASDTAVDFLDCVDNDTIRALGIITNVSSTRYAYRVGVTEQATDVARTTGWHKFEWDYTSGYKVDMYIDGILVASPTGLGYFNRIAVGNWWGGGVAGTNYIDDVFVE